MADNNELEVELKIGLSDKDKQKMADEIYDKVNDETQKELDKMHETIQSFGQLRPAGTDTSTNILNFKQDKGIYVANDTGAWYYWNGSSYVYGGSFQSDINAVDLGKIIPESTIEETMKKIHLKIEEYTEIQNSYDSQKVYMILLADTDGSYGTCFIVRDIWTGDCYITYFHQENIKKYRTGYTGDDDILVCEEIFLSNIADGSVTPEKLSNDILSRQEKTVLLEPVITENARYWYNNGTASANGWNYSKFDVEGLTNVIVSGTASVDGYHYGVHFLDTSNMYISKEVCIESGTNKAFVDVELEVPNGTKYVAINFRDSDKCECKCLKSNVVVAIADLDEELKNDFSKIKEKVLNKKSYIILSFDESGTVYTDGRYNIVKEQFGYNFTFSLSFNNELNPSIINGYQDMINNGCDFGFYNYNTPNNFDTLITQTDETSINTLLNYINDIKNKYENVGIFNSVAWLCTNNKTGNGLNIALKRAGIKFVRGANYGEEEHYYLDNAYIKDFNPKTKINYFPLSIRPSQLEDVKTRIDIAIANGWDLSLMSHAIKPTEEEAETSYSCTRENLIEIMQYLKDRVDLGLCEVVSYRDYYNIKQKEDGYNYDYSRIMKLIDFNK